MRYAMWYFDRLLAWAVIVLLLILAGIAICMAISIGVAPAINPNSDVANSIEDLGIPGWFALMALWPLLIVSIIRLECHKMSRRKKYAPTDVVEFLD